MVDFTDGLFGGGKARPAPTPWLDLQFGRVVITPAAEAYVEQWGVSIENTLQRFRRGDWGELDPEDWTQNDSLAIARSGMILASYPRVAGRNSPGDDRLWVIHYPETGDTTLLLPDDY